MWASCLQQIAQGQLRQVDSDIMAFGLRCAGSLKLGERDVRQCRILRVGRSTERWIKGRSSASLEQLWVARKDEDGCALGVNAASES